MQIVLGELQTEVTVNVAVLIGVLVNIEVYVVIGIVVTVEVAETVEVTDEVGVDVMVVVTGVSIHEHSVLTKELAWATALDQIACFGSTLRFFMAT